MERNPSHRIDLIASTLVTGGAERVAEILARELPKRGFDIEVTCINEAGDKGNSMREMGIPLRSNLAVFRRDPFSTLRLAAWLRKRKTEAIISLDHRDAIICSTLAGGISGVRFKILMVHSTGLWGKRVSFSLVERSAMRFYDRIVALAPSHARYLVERERLDERKIAIIPNGVDIGIFKPAGDFSEKARVRNSLGLGNSDFVVTIVAALRPEKNHSLFIRAAARIREKVASSKFLIVGEGREEYRLRELSSSLGLEGSLIFLGRRSDVPDILAASDILVLCSHPVVETMPLSVLEGMASGLPVVSTDVGSVRDMIIDREDGFIVPCGEVESLVDRVVLVANNRELATAIGARARRRVEREFSMEKMVEEYSKLLNSLLS